MDENSFLLCRMDGLLDLLHQALKVNGTNERLAIDILSIFRNLVDSAQMWPDSMN